MRAMLRPGPLIALLTTAVAMLALYVLVRPSGAGTLAITAAPVAVGLVSPSAPGEATGVSGRAGGRAW